MSNEAKAPTRTDYPSFRAFLEAHPDGEWTFLGGDFAGQRRTSKGILAENNTVAMASADGAIALSEDALNVPVYEKDGTVYIPKGTAVLGIQFPIDIPMMSEEFLR